MNLEPISPVHFAAKEKKSWWNAFKAVTKGIVNSLGSLGSSQSVDENNLLNIEELVCRVYSIKSEIKTVSELRWMMFEKVKQTQRAFRQLETRLESLHFEQIINVWCGGMIQSLTHLFQLQLNVTGSGVTNDGLKQRC